MRIVSIHAHPDDAEILAGGTLALLSELGHNIAILSLSAGDCGSSVHGPEEIAAIRRAEAAESAALIGAEYRWGGFRDLAIFSDDPSRRAVTGLLRELSPEIVLTAAPSDYLSDHEAASQLVRDACFAAPMPNYFTPTGKAPLAAIPHLYFMDPIEHRDRNGNLTVPDFTVNVASTFETKRAMLAKHRSQGLWLQQQHGMDDYLQQMEDWTRACGTRAGVELGEGFRQYRIHPYPREPVLQQMLSIFLGKNGR
ncbi:MAG TPA: PIG-L family deacetylase [Bryobacteraceae bacterium]|jgi:LmbE family N-acetylglucosaminyl deacetylase|nr:PIG-L family deacetylase [Bryobacteraceae bacterium]